MRSLALACVQGEFAGARKRMLRPIVQDDGSQDVGLRQRARRTGGSLEVSGRLVAMPQVHRIHTDRRVGLDHRSVRLAVCFREDPKCLAMMFERILMALHLAQRRRQVVVHDRP